MTAHAPLHGLRADPSDPTDESVGYCQSSAKRGLGRRHPLTQVVLTRGKAPPADAVFLTEQILPT
jgi:2,4-dienoyl-CoA reductase-like NADH-dependent reductase (Old Yellow Enzyme family)